MCFVKLIQVASSITSDFNHQLKSVAIDDMLCQADFQVSSIASDFNQSIVVGCN